MYNTSASGLLWKRTQQEHLAFQSEHSTPVNKWSKRRRPTMYSTVPMPLAYIK